MTDTSLLYVTASSRAEAEAIASTLVKERLVACANIFPGIQSYYWWQGAVHKDDEVVVILKTQTPRVERVTERIGELHSYECPCVIQLPIAGGNPAFITWIQDETAGSA